MMKISIVAFTLSVLLGLLQKLITVPLYGDGRRLFCFTVRHRQNKGLPQLHAIIPPSGSFMTWTLSLYNTQDTFQKQRGEAKKAKRDVLLLHLHLKRHGGEKGRGRVELDSCEVGWVASSGNLSPPHTESLNHHLMTSSIFLIVATQESWKINPPTDLLHQPALIISTLFLRNRVWHASWV